MEVNTKSVLSNRFMRNEYVAELTRRQANGKCELCKQNAPFNNKQGAPFLEVHHIIWLSRGGSDILENTVALCPNCHRRLHLLRSKEDIDLLKKRKN